jgi:hypothetical protein
MLHACKPGQQAPAATSELNPKHGPPAPPLLNTQVGWLQHPSLAHLVWGGQWLRYTSRLRRRLGRGVAALLDVQEAGRLGGAGAHAGSRTGAKGERIQGASRAGSSTSISPSSSSSGGGGGRGGSRGGSRGGGSRSSRSSGSSGIGNNVGSSSSSRSSSSGNVRGSRLAGAKQQGPQQRQAAPSPVPPPPLVVPIFDSRPLPPSGRQVVVRLPPAARQADYGALQLHFTLDCPGRLDRVSGGRPGPMGGSRGVARQPPAQASACRMESAAQS